MKRQETNRKNRMLGSGFAVFFNPRWGGIGIK